MVALKKNKILLFADWYEPGYKAGGPIRSCVNFVDHMKDEYAIRVFTSDRDLGTATPYENIKTDSWNEKGGGTGIYYCSPRQLNRKNIRRQILDAAPDFIYLNSMFSTWFTLFPLLIIRFNNIRAKIMLSPRGMLRASALQFKPFKKMIFLKIFRWLGFHRRIHFLAADATEVKDIQRFFGAGVAVAMIPNLPGALTGKPGILPKKNGELSMIFVGRIHPIKGLDYLLAILQKIQAEVQLTIVGSAEDQANWQKCEQMISVLPGNISVRYLGERPNHELPAIIAQHHIFALPTQGENFGHAIFEALSLGKPVLISDQTPWRNLENAKAGWDLPLDQPVLYQQAIEQAAAFDQETYTKWALTAFDFAGRHTKENNATEKYKTLFS